MTLYHCKHIHDYILGSACSGWNITDWSTFAFTDDTWTLNLVSMTSENGYVVQYSSKIISCNSQPHTNTSGIYGLQCYIIHSKIVLFVFIYAIVKELLTLVPSHEIHRSVLFINIASVILMSFVLSESIRQFKQIFFTKNIQISLFIQDIIF